MDLKPRILEFLYDQVSQNKIPQIKKGMREDLEAFIVSILAEMETAKSAERMQKAVEELPEEEKVDEKNPKE